MFLPSTDSFLLTRRSISKPISPVFLPSTSSFLLVRSSIVRPSFTHEKDGVSYTKPRPIDGIYRPSSKAKDQEQSKVTDSDKRNFLKVAGIAGAGLIASQLSPQKAQALIMGSSPTTGVVGIKDSTNARINPATEETVDSLLKTSDLTFDSGDLQVKVTSSDSGSSFSDSGDVAKSGLVDGDRHVQVDVLSSTLPSSASTETTLQTISFGGVQYSLRLETVGDFDYVGEASVGATTSSSVWRIKRVDNTSGDIAILWADGDETFDNVWDNRASLSYS